MPEIKPYVYHDLLKDYMSERVKEYLTQKETKDLPIEFKDMPLENLLSLIIDMAVPILRKIEDDAILAAMEKSASLIRYSINIAKEKEVV